MERLEPKKGRSPISSLNFERKSDFKKFLKFIKNETEELKGIVEPKRNKVKSILGIGTGLGIFGIGALFLGQTRSDEFEKGEKLDGGVDLFAAIGRRNQPGIKTTPTVSLGRGTGVFKKPEPDLFEKFDEGTRTSVTRGRSSSEKKALKVRPGFAERRAIDKRVELVEKTKDLQKKRDIKKRFSRNLTKTEQLVKVGEVGDQTKKISAPRTPIKNYGKMGFQKFFGGTRIGKVRPQLGFMIDPLSGDVIPDPNATSPEALQNIKRVANKRILENFARLADKEADAVRDAASKTSPPPDVDDFFRGQKYLKNRKKPISRRFKNLREGVMGATDRDPSGRVTDTLSKRTFPEKSPLAKFTRKLFRGNAKITKDTSRLFFGMGYKGTQFSMLSKLINNPAGKVVLFGLDLYNAIRSGKQIFNPRDNLGTALYDLYVSIHNTINKDNPENLKEYYTIPSDERMFKKQFQRNMSIIERRNDAARQKFVEAQGTGSNNIIVIPQNQQNNNMGGGNNLPSTTGGTEVSFVPPEPLNIGDDILLHKLNA